MLILFGKKLIMVVSAALAIAAGSPRANAMSLDEAREEALRANLNIKIAGENVSEAQSVRKQRFTGLLPTLDFMGNVAHIEERPRLEFPARAFGPIPLEDVFIDTGKEDTYKVGVQLEQPVYTFFTDRQPYFSYREAKAHEEMTSWDEQQVIEDVLFSVEQAYFAVLEAEEMDRIARQHEATLQAHLKDIEVLHEKGRVAFNEVLKVRVEVASAKQALIRTANQILVAKGQLNLILSRPFEQPIEVASVEEPVPVEITLEAAREMAMLNRPSLKRARAQREEALLSRRGAEVGYYPDVKLVAEYSHRTEEPSIEPENWLVMLVVAVPLWNWGETGHKIRAAKAIEQQSDYYISALEGQTKGEVDQAWLQIQEADGRIEVVKEAVTQSEENLRITQAGFTQGRKTSTEVLDAEELLAKAQSDHIRARYDAHLARASLRYGMGGMGDEEDVSGEN
jgi:outer membrane protein TolC